MAPFPAGFRSRWLQVALVGGALVLALAPWLRNHGYLRDFYDYGLMMRASGRIAAGERPFVDFVSPQQSATLWLNHVAEQLFGGTFAAMTWGNAGLIGLALALLTFTLSRRLPLPVATLLAFVVVVGSCSQHTIIWYNGVGVVTLAVAAITAAHAPTFSRSHALAHGLTAAALLVGGLNKLNFHAIALACVCGWTLRAMLLRRARWSRTGATLAIWLCAGIAAPLALELLWTGASWSQWLQNVVRLPAAGRGELLATLLDPFSYLHPVHDHYGWVYGPVGATIAMGAAAVVTAGWSGRPGLDRLLLTGAALIAVLATAALIATNIEIVYVALAGGIALLAAIWIGFAIGASTTGIRSLLLWPAAALGALMWTSAWEGQRALFGTASGDRAQFREVAAAAAPAAYLKGTRIPPGLANDLEALATEMPAMHPGERLPYFYGSGLEWLDRVWPTVPFPRLPLLISPTGLGSTGTAYLRGLLTPPTRVTRSFGLTQWRWPEALTALLAHHAEHRRLGNIEIFEHRRTILRSPLRQEGDAVAMFNLLGGSVDPAFIAIDPAHPLQAIEAGPGRAVLGVIEGQGRFTYTLPSQQLRGEALVQWIAPGEETLPATVRFRVSAGPPGAETVLWERSVAVDPATPELALPCTIETHGRIAHFAVSLPPASAFRLRAGWRLPHVLASGVDTPRPPRLRDPALEDEELLPADRGVLFPVPWAESGEAVLRRGRRSGEDLQIASGGELWFRPGAAVRDFRVLIRHAGAGDDRRPVARLVWYKGGRFELFTQAGIPGASGLDVRCWTPEPGGWFGVLIDAAEPVQWVSVRVEPPDP